MSTKVIVIVGPTGVGKSKTAVELALRLNGEIISADSMQIYKGLDIGTAKITQQETKGIPHHLIDIVEPDEQFSVADFQRLAIGTIREIEARNKRPILVGGTGLYVSALIDPYKFQELPVNEERREELHQLAQTKGNNFVHNLLQNIDPQLAEKLHPNDIRRVIRGIEYFEATGEKISQNNFEIKKDKNTEFDPIMIGLTMDRQSLYQRIEQRIDKMIEQGLVEEVRKLVEAGYNLELVSLQGLGYKEIIGYLKQDYSLAEAIRLLKRNTRRFAKRQFTWFKRDERIKWYEVKPSQNEDEIVQEIYYFIAGLLFLS
ncbi:MAG: tRNA (adenosine(37)-N6)-dimethylallyltransferase MiaA [Bacillota bacterium]|nr:tRNA (adenosine(37)-N6)-dimethylallyltransferase MiaA [Bacillota bacterium]